MVDGIRGGTTNDITYFGTVSGSSNPPDTGVAILTTLHLLRRRHPPHTHLLTQNKLDRHVKNTDFESRDCLPKTPAQRSTLTSKFHPLPAPTIEVGTAREMAVRFTTWNEVTGLATAA